MGTEIGLHKSMGALFQVFDKQKGLKNDLIWSVMVMVEEEGGVWLGTYNGGFVHFQNDTFITYDKSHEMHSNSVRSLARDRKGNREQYDDMLVFGVRCRKEG